ncbi:MAG: DUF5131 family protein [Microcoleus sp.]
MSKIEWTDITSNPIHLIREDGSNGGHWCRKVSAGCSRCYAEEQNQSNYFKFASKLPYTGKVPQNLIFDEKVMKKLIDMRSPKKIFLCSMTDLFGEWVPDEWIDKAFAYMAIAKQHTFQILTKRPERMKEYITDPHTPFRVARQIDCVNVVLTSESIQLPIEWPLKNCWKGVSVENQKAANDRIPLLLATPASVRFLSCEPLLESIDIYDELRSGINWAIIGGESGSGARPCDVNWIRSIVKQCQLTNVSVFVKQLGSKPINSHNGLMRSPQLWLNLKDRKGGNIDEFPEDLRIREFAVN